MEQKAKFFIIGLAVLLVISLFISYQNYSTKEALRRQRDELSEKNTSLGSQIGRLEGSLRESENKISALNRQLDEVSRQKDEFETKYGLAKKNQDELMEKLRSQQVPEAAGPQLQALPQNTDIYWAGVLKAKTDLELQLGNIRNELKSVKISNEQLQREKSTLELDISNFRRDNEDLKRQLEYNQKLMDSLAQELVREKNDKMQIQDNFKLVKNENAVLSRQLKSLNNHKVELDKKLEQLQEERSSLERRLTDMETMLTDKLSQINGLKEQIDTVRSGATVETPSEKSESVELPPIIVRPQIEDAAAEAPSLAGKVLAINKDNNFVIIDLGEDAGIKLSDTFRVYRGGKAVATIEVIQTRKNIAACDIKEETAAIIVGDTVK